MKKSPPTNDWDCATADGAEGIPFQQPRSKARRRLTFVWFVFWFSNWKEKKKKERKSFLNTSYFKPVYYTILSLTRWSMKKNSGAASTPPFAGWVNCQLGCVCESWMVSALNLKQAFHTSLDLFTISSELPPCTIRNCDLWLLLFIAVRRPLALQDHRHHTDDDWSA